LWTSILVALLCLVLPATAWAEDGPGGVELCAECHPEEAAAWQSSPHAHALENIDESLKLAIGQESECLACHTTGFDGGVYDHAGVTCEACHGAYVLDHPQNGLMQLSVDSSPCQNCHAATYEEWTNTAHAQSGVQCVGCHQAHTQQTRLSDQELCGSCHRDLLHDFEYTVHQDADVACADCHLPTAAALNTNVGLTVSGADRAPAHNLTVASQTCSTCHATSIHVKAPGEALNQIDDTRLAAMSERVRDLAYELDDTKKENRSLQTLSLVSLGLGLGVGGMLGIVFVAVVGVLSQRKVKS